ncbi:MAG: SufD family Fe-S cluster assembly protein [Candidatus Komeilibacteria bacterium]|nr:SufD family Fe-S cluster assembly protein [Candidatus Komeilibacteria bacterium]
MKMIVQKISKKNTAVRKPTLLLDWQKRLAKIDITVAGETNLTYILLAGFGNTQSREITIRLMKQSSVAIVGIFTGNKKQTYRCDLSVLHTGAGSRSRVVLKGIFTDAADAMLNGTIHILPKGQQADARLEERVLLLSNEARARTIPNLEIEANDVKASHAATVSRISDDELFYLETRGLSKQRAEKMLLSSFLHSPLTALPEGTLRDTLERVLDKKIEEFTG